MLGTPPSPQVFDFETTENFRKKYACWQDAKHRQPESYWKSKLLRIINNKKQLATLNGLEHINEFFQPRPIFFAHLDKFYPRIVALRCLARYFHAIGGPPQKFYRFFVF